MDDLFIIEKGEEEKKNMELLEKILNKKILTNHTNM